MKTRNYIFLINLFVPFFLTIDVLATKLIEVTALDKDIIMVYFRDGHVVRRDDGTGCCAYEGGCHCESGSSVVRFGYKLNTSNASSVNAWLIKSVDDSYYGTTGKRPAAIYRKTKLNGMDELGWGSNDYNYDYTLEHWLYLRLPQSLVQGKTYTLEIGSNTNTDKTSVTFTYDIFNTRSEAIHVNLAGYHTNSIIKAADLYHWMGDGGARDYSGFVGKKVYLYNVNTGQTQEVGQVTFWKNSGNEAGGYNFTRSDVWNADFSSFRTPGVYRLAIEGVGSSQDFEVSENAYLEPLKVSTRGFFYMRIGQNSPNMNPRPRMPLFIPGVDNTTVYITTLTPFHSAWGSIGGDPWDKPGEFAKYTTGRTNPNAKGGHSDAYDWDRHLGHVSIIWDLLLPYIITNGRGLIGSDDLGIAESGNGIPDVIDEAKYEVDFWLRLRDGRGYAHGVSCPYSNTDRRMYQAGTTVMAAWANALNAAMLAEAYRIAGKSSLMQQYRDSAYAAYNYANAQSDQQLDVKQGVGEATVTGRDLKMMAAAYLYNVTGDTQWEDIMKNLSRVTSATSIIQDGNNYSQLWGVAAYLHTSRAVHYPTLRDNMRAAIIKEAKDKEAGYINSRPTRRGTDNNTGYFHTIQNMQRTIIAHSVATGSDKELLEKALILEADWGLGRNPANIIQMTTASTNLGSRRSVEAAYTSGYNDGTPGLHPGHTPYWNMDDWAPGMVMGRPSWMGEKCYPAWSNWPKGELYFNTDYVWAHAEFTPQQTMRGKQALYGYLSPIGSSGTAPATYTLTVRATNGSVTKNPDKASYASGETVQLTAVPITGYQFTGWSGDANTTQNPFSVVINGNKSITANFSSSSDDLIIYTDAITRITGTWALNGSLSEIMGDAYEQEKHYRFQYSFSAGSANFGLNLDKWGSGQGVNVSGYSTFAIALKGPTASSNVLKVRLKDKKGNYGPQVTINNSASYKMVCISVLALKGNTSVDLTIIQEIEMIISATLGGSGDVFLDNVYFTNALSDVPEQNEPQAGIKIFPNPSLEYADIIIDKMNEPFVLRVINANGTITKELVSSVTDSIRLHTKDLPKGFYILNISSASKQLNGKILIQ